MRWNEDEQVRTVVGIAFATLGPVVVALLLVPILVGAFLVHLPNGWVFTATGGGFEYPLFLVAMSFVLWLSGDGAFALRRSGRFTVEARA